MPRAVFWLLRDVTLPALRRHRLRTALTLVGVVIGVQLFVTIQLINRATLQSFEHTIATLAGSADLQLSNGDVGVSEDLVDRIAAVPGVTSASGLVRGTLRTSWGILTVFGVDLFGNQRVRETQFPRRHVHIADELRFANAVDSIALSRSFAARARLGADDAFEAVGPIGTIRLVTRGTLDPVGPATLFGGSVGLVDLPTAQRVFARVSLVDEIAIDLADAIDRPTTIARIEALTAGSGTLLDPQERVGGFAGLLRGLRTIFAITSVLGLTVGSFLVHHAMRSAVLQRRRSFAIARAVGYRRAVVAGAILTEAAIFGVVGGVIGAALSLGAARLAIDAVTAAISAIWTRNDHATVVLGLDDVLVAILVGIAGALLAAIGPALGSARLQVVEQLRSTTERRRTELGRSAISGGIALCVVACGVLWAQSLWSSLPLQLLSISIGTTAMTVGYALLAPALLRLVVAPVRRLTRRRGFAASLAAEHLARDPVRCRGTLGALMAAFAFVLCVSAFVGSLGTTILTWTDQALGADLFVSATADLPLPSAPTLPASVEGELRAMPGVADATPTRMVLAPVAGRMVGLKAERAAQFRARPFPVVERTSDDYLDDYASGAAILMSDNLAFQLQRHAGDVIEIDSPSGRQRFRIAAVVLDYTMDIGTVTIDTDVYRRLWKDEQVTTFLVHAERGTDLVDLRTAIGERFSGRLPLNVLTAGEFKRNVMAAIDGAFVLTYAIQLVAAVIAGVGVVNFFLAEIIDRRREIGLLRAVALDRGQLLRTLTVEATLIGAVGGLLAMAWGWPIAKVIVTHSARLVSGWRLDFDFPWRMALLTPLVVAATAGIAALLPARATVRMPVSRLVGVE